MSENNKIKAEEWYEKAKHDFESAELIINSGGHTDTASILLQQALEKYLKGYLISRGWHLVKTHNIKELLQEATKYEKCFEDFYAIAEKLTLCYVELKYPFSSSVIASSDEIKKDLETVKKIVTIILKNRME